MRSAQRFIRRAGALVPLRTGAGPDPGPGPSPGPGPGVSYSLLGRPGFNPNSPTWRDGTSMTGEAASLYEGLNWHLVDPQGRQPTDSFYNAYSLAARDDTYLYGRTLAEIYAGYETALRLTGDLRWLDLWADVAQVQFDSLNTGWAHGRRAWNWRQGGSSTTTWGDTHRDAARTHAPLATLAYALDVNRSNSSPGGKNYGALADQWKTYLWEDFHYIWARGSGSWTSDYGAFAGDGEYTGRARPNMLKFFGRPHTHSHVGYTRLGYWMGRLFPDHPWEHASGSPIDAQGMIDLYIDEWLVDKNFYETPNSKYGGNSITWARSMQHFQSGNNYHQPITYATYIFMDMLSFYLEGASGRDYGKEFFERVWPSVNAWAWIWPWNGNTATSDDIGGNTNRTGVNSEGDSLTIVASNFGPRSYTNMAAYAYSLSLAWDTDDGWGLARFKSAWESVSAFWGSSGNKIGTPRHVIFPIGWLASLSGMNEAQPGPGPGPGPSGDWSLVGNPSFTPSSLTGETKTWFDRAAHRLPTWYADSDPVHTIETVQGPGFDNSDPHYHMARHGGPAIATSIMGLRATGYLGFVDAICDILDALKTRLQTNTHGFREFEQPEYTSNLNDSLLHGYLAQGVHAVWANRHHSSPGASDSGKTHDYQAVVDFWIPYLRVDFRDKWWSGARHGTGYNVGWNGGAYGSGSSARRTPDGQWPFLWRDHRHAFWPMIGYMHAMYAMTGESIYQTWRDNMLSHYKSAVVEDPATGDYVWSFRAVEGSMTHGATQLGEPRSDDRAERMQPSTYFNYGNATVAYLWGEGLFTDEELGKFTACTWRWMPLGGYQSFQGDGSRLIADSIGGGTTAGTANIGGMLNSGWRGTMTQENIAQREYLFPATVVHPEARQLARYIYENVFGTSNTPNAGFLPMAVLVGLMAEQGGPPDPDPEPPPEGDTLTELDVLLGTSGATAYGGSPTAFPSAEGYGRHAVGARSGGSITVYYVTNLNDSGQGSLRAAVEASGPRIVVILVSGWIRLTSGIRTGGGSLTIYGNWVKAPHKGHAIRMYRTSAWGGETQPLIMANGESEFIFRYLRGYRAPHSSFISAGHTEGSGDAFTISDASSTGAQNAILDHVNMAFTTDDIGGLTTFRNGTEQHNFYGDPIARLHDSGLAHDYGPLVTPRGNETHHHNFYTRINERSPRIAARSNVQIDVYNIYNYNTTPGYQFVTNGSNSKIHFTDNWTQEGPHTLDQNKPYWGRFLISSGDPFQMYLARNRGWRISGTSLDAMWANAQMNDGLTESQVRSDSQLFTPPAKITHDVDTELRPFIRRSVGFSWVIDPDTRELRDVRDSYHLQRINESVSGGGPSSTLSRFDVEATLPTDITEWTPPGSTYTEQVNWFLTNYFQPWAASRSDLGVTGSPAAVRTVNGRQYTEIELYLLSLIPDFGALE